ncbi:MAG: GFA family protein [Sphingomonas sp.]|uniref:GFA family protein n=1 Tax=Sphingomonas sp. TaxID=28214 RepID=UPI002273DE91|nr:GFA family protein [Sphingomonas sp.]MCX8474417.1 GFA family protein [Sphingomonas sp.]
MTDAPGTVEGGCRCARVRFRLSGAPIFTAACHCRGCQRMTASAYSVSGAWPADRFEVIAGEPVIGGMHGATRHYFCGHCLSWMFTRPEGFDAFVNVRTTLLDAPPKDPPFLETFTSEALPWAKTGATHSFETFPPPEAFEPLTREFADSRSG